MVDKEEQKRQVQRHEALMRGAFASETAATVEAARIYEDGDGRILPLPEPAAELTRTIVTTSTVLDALYREAKGKTVVVDAASFTRPGGTYEDGAFGPEQILCLQSNLFQVLCGLKQSYYAKNRGYRCGQLFTDRAAYLPDVAFSRDGDVLKADIVVVAEPMRARALENHRSQRECDLALENRIETILRIAASNGCETLVMGAFGCGRLGYSSQQVVGVLRAWVDAHPGAIPRIVFAVPRLHLAAFDAAFGVPKGNVAPKFQHREDEGEDGFDLSGINLPEGVTLR